MPRRISGLNQLGVIVKTIENISGENIEIDRNDLSGRIYVTRLIQAGKILKTGKLVVSQ